MLWGVTAVAFGFHPAIGAYMGGLILEEVYFDTLTGENQYHVVLHHIETVAYGWLGPFFFLELGAMIPIEGEMISKVIGPVLIFYLLLFVGQFLSASIAARYVPGGFTWAEAAMIGFGMMGRAELFFVVLDQCATLGIMNTEIIITFSLVAMLMNISVPVCIALYRPIYMKYTDEKPSEPLTEGKRRPSLDKHNTEQVAAAAAATEAHAAGRLDEDDHSDGEGYDLQDNHSKFDNKVEPNDNQNGAPAKKGRSKGGMGLVTNLCGCGPTYGAQSNFV
jgi:hypothetical protein